MKKTYRRHSEEFKKEVIDYFLSSSKSITQICKELTKSQRREDILKKAALILGNDPRNDMS
ncbi:MAG: hypothetical protein ACSHX0_02625 [Akkermansiaceae bacterium]